MYLLQHGVNLSRRACRTGAIVLLLAGLAASLPKPESPNDNAAVESLMYPKPDLQPFPADYNSHYKGMQFGPMGPDKRDTPVETTSATTTSTTTTTTTTTSPSTDTPSSTGPTEKTEGPKRYQILSVSFGRVEIPFIIGVWILCASIAKIGFHMVPRWSEIFPESCLLIVVGVIIGVILVYGVGNLDMSPLKPDTFFLYMLPPIILDAGYFMPNRLFFDHLGTILIFAVLGTIFNTLTIGASLWAVGKTGLFGLDTPLLQMFLFSSLISAVDPVAVLAVFEEIQVNEILYIVVFGESLLNDAVTVVLYHMFESYTAMGLENIIYTDVLSGFANFFVVAIGGTVIGVIWGFATGFVTRFTNEVRVIEPIFIFVMAYLAYLNAEIFHMSGILAITFCGITMKNYVEANISHKSHTTIKYAMKMLSSSSETVIFMFLGVATVNKEHQWNTLFVILTIIFCSVYRILGVILLTAIANKFRLHQLSTVEKFVMSYGGLRGAVAFALVLLIEKSTVTLQPMFMTTTIAVVYFTVFIQGITIKPLVKLLNVKTAEKRKPTMNERIHERLMDHTMAAIEDIVGQHGNYHVRDRFKRFDNKFIRPYLLRNHQGAEPKILETYSKLAMRDAMDYMRRNASTIGNISGTESMSAIFRNYTAGNLNGSNSVSERWLPNGDAKHFHHRRSRTVEPGRKGHPEDMIGKKVSRSASFSQLDSSTWNIDMQELEYNPSKKDLTDAKIHHLLAEELCKPYRRHRRLSYSRHAVNDRDLSTQVNYRMQLNFRRLVADKKHHHKRHSKKLNKDGKQNHVSFPEFQQNGTAKQFSHDYINEVLHEDDTTEPKSSKDEWDSPITFTAKSSPSEEAPLSAGTEGSGSLNSQLTPLMGPKCKITTAVEGCLPWRREKSNYNVTDDSLFSDTGKRLSKGSIDGGDLMRVTTPTATESVLPWKRDDELDALQQNEFPAWASNKEYLAYNSPSATFLGGIENPRSSVIGLFRRESTGSAQMSSNESSPQRERRGSNTGPNAVLLIEETVNDPLGAVPKPGTIPPPPQTPSGQRRQARRGSMLELSGSITRDTIPEENCSSGSGRRPSWLLPLRQTPRPQVRRQQTLGTSLMSRRDSPSSGESSDEAQDIECLMKASGF